MTNRVDNNVHIHGTCRECLWPVLFCLTNWDSKQHPQSDSWDWWVYCTNKSCKHHEGEGKFQGRILWIKNRYT